MCDFEQEEEQDKSVLVKVDVTKIVKYVCMTGAFIVAAVFACKACAEYFSKDKQ